MQIGHNLSTNYSLINEQNGERPDLEITTEEKDVCTYLVHYIKYNYTLSMSLQCHKATSKAMRFLGLINRTFKHPIFAIFRL